MLASEQRQCFPVGPYGLMAVDRPWPGTFGPPMGTLGKHAPHLWGIAFGVGRPNHQGDLQRGLHQPPLERERQAFARVGRWRIADHRSAHHHCLAPGLEPQAGCACAPRRPSLEGGAELAEDALNPQSAKTQTRSNSELIEQFVQARCPMGHTEQNYQASLRRWPDTTDHKACSSSHKGLHL